jgi:gamma-glutamyl:cysteine ligase YbdK (ATP-grasp superfamily)
MIVDRDSLSVLPVSDRLLQAVSGRCESEVETEVEMGALNWSNELVLHVIELKTSGPAPDLKSLPGAFQSDVRRINALLDPLRAVLMPTAMHPWMDPRKETAIWPHEYNAVYDSFNRIFGCDGHGWSNVQSMHINLPFADDAEFGKLHAAVRLVLPLLPALAASSPVVEGCLTGFMDTRLEWTRHNQDKVPSLTGKVIPEPLYTRLDYQNRLLNGLYRDIAPLDPEKTLQNEWVNSRGAIARFDRNTIEIRVIDMQECPAADLAVASAVVEWIHLIVDETWAGLDRQKSFSTEALFRILLKTIRHGDAALIDEHGYSSLFGFDAQSMTAGTFWKRLFNDHLRGRIQECFHAPLLHIIKKGPLARRIISALGDSFPVSRLQSLYRRLTECLQSGTLFE